MRRGYGGAATSRYGWRRQRLRVWVRLPLLGFKQIMLGRYASILSAAVARGKLRPLRNPAAPGSDTGQAALT